MSTMPLRAMSGRRMHLTRITTIPLAITLIVVSTASCVTQPWVHAAESLKGDSICAVLALEPVQHERRKDLVRDHGDHKWP